LKEGSKALHEPSSSENVIPVENMAAKRRSSNTSKVAAHPLLRSTVARGKPCRFLDPSRGRKGHFLQPQPLLQSRKKEAMHSEHTEEKEIRAKKKHSIRKKEKSGSVGQSPH